MRTISDHGSRSVGAALAVLAGSLLLSACDNPVAPTTPDVEAAAATATEGGRASKSGTAANLRPCWYCPSAIDPVRVPPNKPVSFQAYVANTGDAPAPSMHVSLFLVGTDGRRIPVSETDHASPHPGEQVALDLAFLVPARTPAGRYVIGIAVDPDNRIAESDETDNAGALAAVLEVAAP